VLKDLHYPPEIIRVMQKVLKDIVI
jgi:hypothetical protein